MPDFIVIVFGSDCLGKTALSQADFLKVKKTDVFSAQILPPCELMPDKIIY
jgi:hypothetical protein